jgi:protein SCO1/2
MARLRRALALAALASAALPAASHAQFMTGLRVDKERAAQQRALDSKALVERVGFDQRIGAQLPLDTLLRDERGRSVRLGDFFGERPVVLAFVYYRCPLLCTLVERAVARSLKPLDFTPGEELEIVFVSFDPSDTPADAAAKKAETLEAYGRPAGDAGWHFLTGGAEAIAAVTDAAGFRYLEADGGQFAHASGVVVATADGRLARYLYGADYASRDLKLALVEAADGKLGGVVEQAMLVCFQYNADLGKYTAATFLLLKIGATLTLIAVGGFVGLSLFRERRARLRLAGGAA